VYFLEIDSADVGDATLPAGKQPGEVGIVESFMIQ